MFELFSVYFGITMIFASFVAGSTKFFPNVLVTFQLDSLCEMSSLKAKDFTLKISVIYVTFITYRKSCRK